MNESKNFNQDFSLSKEALERVKILLKDEEGSYFRISVLGGGCPRSCARAMVSVKSSLIFRALAIDLAI